MGVAHPKCRVCGRCDGTATELAVCARTAYGIVIIDKTQLCKAEALVMGYFKQLSVVCLWACLARFTGGL